MVQYAKRRRKAKPKNVKLKTASLGPRVILVFGPPSVGVSTAVDCLSQASITPTAVLAYSGPDSIAEAEDAHNFYEVVFLDVEGGVIGPADIQALVDAGLLSTNCGAVIRVYAPDELILARAESRPDYVKTSDLQEWNIAVSKVEDVIRLHTLQYFMVPNLELADAVRNIALRAGLQE